MDARPMKYCTGVSEAAYRRGERAVIEGVAMVQIRAYVEKPALLTRFPDGQDHAVLFEDVVSGLYLLEP
jgi:hypothetical protein